MNPIPDPNFPSPIAERPSLQVPLARLKQLVRLVGNADKKRTGELGAARTALAEALRTVEATDWPALHEALKAAHDEIAGKHEAELRVRRETLLKAAQTAGVHTEARERSDRIGVFNVVYEGLNAVVTLGGVRVASLKGTDGNRLFEQLRRLLLSLEQTRFEREDFFRLIKGAYASCRSLGSPGDEFVPLRDLYRELIFERARHSERFCRSPDARNIEPYPLHQFIFDLARFLQGGVTVAGERLQTRSPSMRENKDTVFIPNLEHPGAAEIAAAQLAIKPA